MLNTRKFWKVKSQVLPSMNKFMEGQVAGWSPIGNAGIMVGFFFPRKDISLKSVGLLE